MVKKGQTFILDFLQSHIEISANFTCADKNLVLIDQGKSILFEYQHASLQLTPIFPSFFHEIYPLDDLDIYWQQNREVCANAGISLAARNFTFTFELRAANEMPACCQ